MDDSSDYPNGGDDSFTCPLQTTKSWTGGWWDLPTADLHHLLPVTQLTRVDAVHSFTWVGGSATYSCNTLFFSYKPDHKCQQAMICAPLQTCCSEITQRPLFSAGVRGKALIANLFQTIKLTGQLTTWPLPLSKPKQPQITYAYSLSQNCMLSALFYSGSNPHILPTHRQDTSLCEGSYDNSTVGILISAWQVTL